MALCGICKCITHPNHYFWIFLVGFPDSGVRKTFCTPSGEGVVSQVPLWAMPSKKIEMLLFGDALIQSQDIGSFSKLHMT